MKNACIFASIWMIILFQITLFLPLCQAEELMMNHIQVIGTHNSYHVKPKEPLFSQIKAANPDAAASWDYTHLPLDQQLDHGVRSFELDTYFDPEGIKVFHFPDYDIQSNCPLFVDCLMTLKYWSDAHPNHVPIIILVQAKDAEYPNLKTKVYPYNKERLDELDKELLSVFSKEQLITPDDVRKDAATLEEAVLTKGWLSLEEARGRFIFALHDTIELCNIYADGRPSLEGRPMFATTEVGRPDASIIVLNNPTDEKITELVKLGYIVRTRADSDVKDAAAGDTTRREAALNGNAHIITTDFPAGQPHPDSGYSVFFPGKVAVRCHPLFTESCEPEKLEAIEVKH